MVRDSSPTLSRRREIGCAVVLCAVGGWVDAVSYLRFGSFSGAMSGNSILLGIAVARGAGEDVLFYVCVIAAFLAAIIAARWGLTRGVPQGVLLTLCALLVAGAALPVSHWVVVLLAFALGVQNASMRRFAGVTLNSVFITGNLEQLGEAVPKLELPAGRRQVRMISIAWASYALGAACGAAALHIVRRVAAIPLVLGAPAALILAAALALPATSTRAQKG